MERDNFLTEAMGECWHEKTNTVAGNNVIGFMLCTCGDWYGEFDCGKKSIDFSTWQGFGKLWEWSQKREWWGQFVEDTTGIGSSSLVDVDCIDPDRFADALYEFLKGR